MSTRLNKGKQDTIKATKVNPRLEDYPFYSAPILATAYLRLIARHGPNWRKRLELGENQKVRKSAKNRSNRLDYSAERSMRCPGERTVTVTLTRS